MRNTLRAPDACTSRIAFLHFDRSRKYPIRLRLTRSVEIRAHVSRPRSVACIKDGVVRTEITGWFVSAERRIGYFELALYKLDPGLWDEDFCTIMDLEHQHEWELATALSMLFGNACDYLQGLGPILLLRMLVIDKEFAGDQVSSHFLEILHRKLVPNYSVIALQAGLVDEHPYSEERIERRLGIIMRYCGQKLGVKAFPDWPGRLGWMWAPHPQSHNHHLHP